MFKVNKSFFEIFPNAKLGVVVIKNMDNTKNSDEIITLLENANEEAKKYLVNEQLSENEVIKVYREAYTKFKTKKGARSSIEALLKRVKQGKPVGNINPLVDIYNSASLKFGLPCGAEDIDTFKGDLELTITSGGDDFYPLGDDKNEPTLDGELCYKDELGAVCRCFNWRDGVRTMITESTKNAFIIMELIDENRENVLNEALDYIVENSKKYTLGDANKYILDRENSSLEL